MQSSSSPPSSSFSLVARDLAREHGAHTVLDGVDVSVGPRTRARGRRPQRGREDHALASPRRSRAPRPRHGHHDAAHAAGRVPGAGTRTPRRDGAGVPVATHRRHRRGSGTGADRRRARERTGRRCRRVRGGARRLPRGRWTRSRRARPGRLRRRRPRAPAARCVDAGPLGRRGRPRVLGCHPAQSSRRAAPRRAHQRPRFRRAGAARDVRRRTAGWRGAREPRPRLPRTYGHPRPRARRAHALRHRVRRGMARLPRGARHRTAARRRGLRHLPRRAWTPRATRAHPT